MFGVVRIAVLAFAVLVFLAGALAIVEGGPDAAGPGVWLVALGAIGIVVMLFERSRYRSEVAERTREPVGPGGGELGERIEPRFQPTSELFRDPTSGHLMRVFVDNRTGERRYVAED